MSLKQNEHNSQYHYTHYLPYIDEDEECEEVENKVEGEEVEGEEDYTIEEFRSDLVEFFVTIRDLKRRHPKLSPKEFTKLLTDSGVDVEQIKSTFDKLFSVIPDDNKTKQDMLIALSEVGILWYIDNCEAKDEDEDEDEEIGTRLKSIVIE